MLQLQTVLQTLAPTSGIERAGDQQLQTVLQTLAPTLGIERAGEQLQIVRVREGRKNQFHVEPMVHKAGYPLFVP